MHCNGIAISAAALALSIAPRTLSGQNVAAPPAARAQDVASIDAIVRALYDVISGPAGERDWARFRSLFLPGARLVPASTRNRPEGRPVTILTVEDYIQRTGAFFRQSGFFEQESARRTERFGNIAHVFSTYESRRAAAEPEPFARGLNSIQLVQDQGRWWVANITWDEERPDNPIPANYRPDSGN